jgi:hypothetical protein
MMPERKAIGRIAMLATALLQVGCGGANRRGGPFDAVERQAELARMRVQIAQKTRGLPEQRYRRVVRPSLERQLRTFGYDGREIDVVLERR